ncbi:nucleotidyltransferase family protein [Vogesella urethralis]|uniref:nucleotidyltransferase family protein n=1 Tax=Vogesella urethralis TaxID=2592656 RepID=UPI001185B98C|nr:nucleotidyltransferase family protein [Vogesella urethralis]
MPATAGMNDAEATAQLAIWLRADAFRWQCLQTVRDALPVQAWLAAGFIRNLVWDQQHGYLRPTPLPDIDVIYQDAEQQAPAHDHHYEALLSAQLAAGWQVRNQARMAARQQHAPYPDCASAIRHWPETATCYAVRLDADNQLQWLAPLGWAPLFAGEVVRNPLFAGGDTVWQQRLQQKQWRQRWPQLRLVT